MTYVPLFRTRKVSLRRNLKYMQAFAEARPDESFVQEVLAQLPWYHHLALLDKLPGPETRKWYVAKAIEHNWSRNVLVMQIGPRLLERSGKAVTNFPATLPVPKSDVARESIKDPYRFDLLGLTDEAQEKDIEGALFRHVTEFLLELGAGFAFVGRQVLLNVGGDEFFIDLLFYHLKLRCYVVIESKAMATALNPSVSVGHQISRDPPQHAIFFIDAFS